MMTAEVPARVTLSEPVAFATVRWTEIPHEPGVYVIADQSEIVYVGMAVGSIRNRLRDHASGQIVNMFAQYLFLGRVQFIGSERITDPRNAKAACREYIANRCTFQYVTTANAAAARSLENKLKEELEPLLNP